MAEGLQDDAIARRAGISTTTVRRHIAAIMAPARASPAGSRQAQRPSAGAGSGRRPFRHGEALGQVPAFLPELSAGRADAVVAGVAALLQPESQATAAAPRTMTAATVRYMPR